MQLQEEAEKIEVVQISNNTVITLDDSNKTNVEGTYYRNLNLETQNNSTTVGV